MPGCSHGLLLNVYRQGGRLFFWSGMLGYDGLADLDEQVQGRNQGVRSEDVVKITIFLLFPGSGHRSGSTPWSRGRLQGEVEQALAPVERKERQEAERTAPVVVFCKRCD